MSWESTDEKCEQCGESVEVRREDGREVAERCSAGCYEGKTLNRFRAEEQEIRYFIYEKVAGHVDEDYSNAKEALEAARDKGVEEGVIGIDLYPDRRRPETCPTVLSNVNRGWEPVILDDTHRCDLIHEVYRVLHANTCGFDQGTLIALSYLYPAIVADEQIDAFDETGGNLYDEFVDLVEALFPPEHGIWKFIRLEP